MAHRLKRWWRRLLCDVIWHDPTYTIQPNLKPRYRCTRCGVSLDAEVAAAIRDVELQWQHTKREHQKREGG